MKQLSDDKGELNAEGGKNDLQQIKCGWVDVCPFSRLNHQSERVTEMLKWLNK